MKVWNGKKWVEEAKRPKKPLSRWKTGQFIHGPRLKKPSDFISIRTMPVGWAKKRNIEMFRKPIRASKLKVGKLKSTGKWAVQSYITPVKQSKPIFSSKGKAYSRRHHNRKVFSSIDGKLTPEEFNKDSSEIRHYARKGHIHLRRYEALDKYLPEQNKVVEEYALEHNIPMEKAYERWVDSGLAEAFSKKYRAEYGPKEKPNLSSISYWGSDLSMQKGAMPLPEETSSLRRMQKGYARTGGPVREGLNKTARIKDERENLNIQLSVAKIKNDKDAIKFLTERLSELHSR